MKITKITLRNFHAFKYECEIDLPKGRNLLLYGENGSGKSSLYQALNLCLAPATLIGDHKNIFVTTNDGFVKLEIGDGANPPDKLEWDETSHPYTQALIVEASKTKGFLDYRSLLETHFVHRRALNVNIFDLLVINLLANIENPVTHGSFPRELETIQFEALKRRAKSRTEKINSILSDYNAGLFARITELQTKTNDILKLFDQSVSMKLSVSGTGLSYNPSNQLIENQEILLTVDYYGQDIPNHHHFLNEARLSAIAISIYLGALLLNPPSQLRVLFLDDVLIGLDMSNRLPLLDILEKYFADWQVILATFDKVWFDMAWQRVKGLKTWQQGELYCSHDNECDIPIYKGNAEYLNVAKNHLDTGDLRAAAIYIRAAYEREIKHFCDRCNLPVRYCGNPKEQQAEDFWKVVKAQKRKDGSELLNATTATDVELFRSTILNQLSHTAPVHFARIEVEKAHTAIATLKDALQPVKKSDLQ
ncbi:DNA replication and repair protein RecF [subsurface metagenome]